MRRFKSCLRHVGDLRWWRSMKMILAGNKPFFGQPYHKTIHHHHHHHHHHHQSWSTREAIGKVVYYILVVYYSVSYVVKLHISVFRVFIKKNSSGTQKCCKNVKTLWRLVYRLKIFSRYVKLTIGFIWINFFISTYTCIYRYLPTYRHAYR